jgi:four helix bundle protein
METIIMTQRKDTFSFEDLIAWQKGHKLLITVFKQLKEKENTIDRQFDVQMKQTAIAICSQIAAGYEQSVPTITVDFLQNAKGAAASLTTQIILAKELGYFEPELTSELYALAKEVSKIIQGLINYISNKHESNLA